MQRFGLIVAIWLIAAPLGAQSSDLLTKAKATLATIDGELAIPGLKDKVEVLRDRWGIPHIYAKNSDDLFFAQGFVAAQDRLFQIDWWRRVANGETAEVLGPEAVEGDRFAKLIRYPGVLEEEWASYGPDTRQIAWAFTSGINAYIDHIGKNLPIEFQILGFAPRHWEPWEFLGRMSGIIMSSNFQREIMRAKLVAAVGVEKARWLAPTDPPSAYASDPEVDLNLVTDKILSGFQAASKALKFKPSTMESNNWVIDGTLSKSGKPMLASDPHRAIALPSLRYLVHLNAPGWNVIGAGEPGLPGVAIGHNERIAWGMTIVGTDQADIFVEKTDPQDEDQLRYRVGDRWEEMVIQFQAIRVKGQERPIGVLHRYTRHGPVIFQDEKNNLAYVLKWAGSEPGGAGYLGSLAVGRARNRQEFLKAIERWKIPALNLVYADVDGNIGWVAAGLTPIRAKGHGLLPVPGHNGKYDWTGYLPVRDLPQSFNPPTRFLATANHNILPPGYKHEIAYEWASSYRIDTIRQSLNAKKQFDLDDFTNLQHSNLSQPGLALARLVKQVTFKDSDLAAHAKTLADWDGVLSTESQAGVIYAYWLRELQDAFFVRHVDKKLVPVLKSLSGLPVMLAALEKPARPWFGENSTAERDDLLRTTFTAAIKKAKLDKTDSLRWGQLHTVTFRHPLESLGKDYAKTFNIGPFERPGDGNCPNNTRYDDNFKQIHGATYRHVLDLADWDRGLATSAPGQSGQFGSPHYDDLAPMWAEGKYFPLYFSRAKVEEATKHRLVLKPAGNR